MEINIHSMGFENEPPGREELIIDGISYRKGEKVRLSLGGKRSDIMDMIIDGKVATIEKIFIDYEGNNYLAVTVDDDPAQQLQRESGRFMFFSPEEVIHI